MMHKEIDVNKPLTDAQIAMLQALEARPDEPDTDCPELTEAQLSQFQKAHHFQAEQQQLHLSYFLLLNFQKVPQKVLFQNAG